MNDFEVEPLLGFFMKKIFSLSILINICFFNVFSQASDNPYRDPEQVRLAQQKQDWDRVRRNLDTLDSLATKRIQPNKPPIPFDFRRTIIENIYRNSYFNERELLSPPENLRTKFINFLKKKNTGMFRLVADLGCDELSNKSGASVICEKFSMPGGGSAYSFRRKDYQMWKLADLLYDGKSFLAFGEMSLGFLVNLGDLDLDKVNRQTKGVSFVYSFVPKKDSLDLIKQNAELIEGINQNGFTYKKYLPVIEGETYILRSIAYQGEIFREYQGYRFNELDFDNRQDVIVAFKVVEKDFNGTITILWKLLQSKKSLNLNS